MESAKRAGDDPNKLPFIQNKPRIGVHLERFWRAWLDLRSCAGDYGVPWTAIHEYCAVHGWTLRDVNYLTKVCRALDCESASLRAADMKRDG